MYNVLKLLKNNNMKYIKIINMLVLFCLTFNFISCDKFDSDQTKPAYIRVHCFKMVPNTDASFTYNQDEGFLSSDIPDVWVSIKDKGEVKELGGYSFKEDSTILIPILAKGKHIVQLKPGVKYNGMASTREYYQFYTYFSDTLNLQEGKIIDIDVKPITYNSKAAFSYVWMFEDMFNPFENFSNIDASVANYMKVITGDSVAYGIKCGAFYSFSMADNYKVVTRDSISCSNTSAMILELDYHSNIPFEVGIYGQTSSSSQYYTISCIHINANDKPFYPAKDKRNWKKMYIILGKVWSQLSYQPFKIWFMPVNKDNIKNGFVHIDNIKIVHFPQIGS